MVYFGIAKGTPDMVQAGGTLVFLMNILGKLKGEAVFPGLLLKMILTLKLAARVLLLV